jgi:hypothetical protein
MRKFLIIIAFIFTTQLAFAWGQNGHRIVAQICFDNLSPEAKKNIQTLLGDDYLTRIATWPDFIRSEKNWNFAKPWHFITVDNDQSVQDVMDKASHSDKIENVIEAIELMREVLRNDSEAKRKFQQLMKANNVEPLSGSIEGTAIAFLVHFIGDIHQPMHCGKELDAGGNKIDVLFFSEKTNLHSVWDEGIIEQEQLSFTEFSTFVDKRWQNLKEDCENDPIDKWAEESVLVRDQIYNALCESTDEIPCLPDFSYQYQHDFLPLIEKRLGAAGFRAAAVFNAIFI